MLLNRGQPEYFKNVTYSDGIARKYAELSFAIEVVSGVESWHSYRTETMSGFYEPIQYIPAEATFADQLATGQFYQTEQQLAV